MKLVLAVTFLALQWALLTRALAAENLPVLRVPLGVNVQTLDPSEAEDFVTIRILMNVGAGLVTLDKNLKPVPLIASSWKVSSDGKTYTFKLGKHFWSDDTPITAGDYLRGWEHTFNPSTAAKIGVPFLGLIEGAKEYKSKTLTDFSKTGMKALDGETLQVSLNHPAAYFLSLLALPVMFPEPKKTDFKIKPGTPTSGAYVVSKMGPDKIILDPNPASMFKAVNRLELKIVTEPSTALSLYEKNQLDVLDRFPSQDFPRFKNSPELNSAPWLSTYYLGFNVTKEPFKDKNLRKAVMESINRNDIEKIMKDPQKPSSSWVPAPLETSDLKYGPPFDPADAKKLWEAAKLPKNTRLEIYFDSQEKNTLIAALIQSQLKENLGGDFALHSMEWKSYLHFLKDEKPAMFRFAWLAAFPDPLSHLGVFTSGNPNNYTGYASAEYDKLVDEISKTPESKKRTDLIKKAQDKLLTEDLVIYPLYHYVQYVLIRRNWQGLDLTPMGLLYFHRGHPKP